MAETNICHECLINDYTTFLGPIGYKYVDLLWCISNDIKITNNEKNKILEMYRELCENYKDNFITETDDNVKTIMNLSDIYWVYHGMIKVIDTFDSYKHIKIISEKIVELTKKDINKNILFILNIYHDYVYQWLILDGDIDKLLALLNHE